MRETKGRVSMNLSQSAVCINKDACCL